MTCWSQIENMHYSVVLFILIALTKLDVLLVCLMISSPELYTFSQQIDDD